MGILSGMLVVLCVKIFTGKKFPLSFLKKNEANSALNQEDLDKNKTHDNTNIKTISCFDRIKIWITKNCTKK